MNLVEKVLDKVQSQCYCCTRLKTKQSKFKILTYSQGMKDITKNSELRSENVCKVELSGSGEMERALACARATSASLCSLDAECRFQRF